MNWLVNRRSKVQSALIAIHRLLVEFPIEIRSLPLKEHPGLEAQIFLTSVAVAFSLWRAVFLADVVGRRVNELEHAELFLERLIHDNAIAYPQDRASNEWSFRYYLNNAQYRLNETANLMNDRTDMFVPPPRRWDEHDTFGPGPRDQWDIVYERFSGMLANLETWLGKRAASVTKFKIEGELRKSRQRPESKKKSSKKMTRRKSGG